MVLGYRTPIISNREWVKKQKRVPKPRDFCLQVTMTETGRGLGCFKMQKVKISRWGSPKIGYYTKLRHCKRNWDFSCKIVAPRNFFVFNGDFGGFQWRNGPILNIMLENDLNMINLVLTHLNQPWGPP